MLDDLLRELAPRLNPGVWVFIAAPEATPGDAILPLARFREAEGESWLVEEADARRLGAAFEMRCAWITLGVHSDLAAVGLTAAVARALANHGIACNVIAALRHDHLLVPRDRADEALGVLQSLATARARAD